VRLAVYVNGFPARIREAIAESFPAVEHVVGESSFTQLTHRYIAREPFSSYSLNDAGAALTSFLGDDELTLRFPFLPDLAGLEWEIALAFHAREEEAVNPAELVDWSPDDWEKAVFRFQPSVGVLRSDWPVRDIWERRDTPLDQIDVDVTNRPQNVLVTRNGLQIQCTLLSTEEALAVEALLQGQRLGRVIEQIAEAGLASDDVFDWFSGWMRGGLLVELRRSVR
jgi:hypothetical protein